MTVDVQVPIDGNVFLRPDITREKRLEVVTPLNNSLLLDVSELYRPEIQNANFRKFITPIQPTTTSEIDARVFQLYKNMHTQQTVDYVNAKREKWLKFNHGKYHVMDALESLCSIIDQSDPDVDVPNIFHGFQTAERIREKHPNEDWFHLTGLMHDLGKVMAVWGEDQWAVVGDTFPVGCAPQRSIVFSQSSFDDNVDLKNPAFNTKNGMYKPHCGLDNIMMSWGHDEYLYHVLKNHPACTLPPEALFIVRYHSFYPWHTGGDYWHLANAEDEKHFYWVREFNKFDLYSKSDKEPDLDELKKYYGALIDKYIPGEVAF